MVPLLALLMLGGATCIFAQAAKIIEGRVTDRYGKPIDGAFLQMAQESYVTHSDERGIYRFRYMTPGDYSIQVSCPGYQPRTIEVKVSGSEEKIRKDVNLEPVHQIASSLHQGQINNYVRQLRSLYPIALIPYQQSDWYGDSNITEVFQYLPGVNVKYGNGQVDSFYLRGAGMDQSVVLIDGMPIISQSLDSRFPNLAGMSTRMFSDIELIRMPGPDMTAEELGGVVNLITSRPMQGETKISIQAVGRYRGDGNAINPNLSFRYNQQFNKFGIVAQGQYRKDNVINNRTSLSWKDTTIVQQKVPLRGITVMDGDYWRGTNSIDRYGASGEVHFEPALNSYFYIRGLFTAEENSLSGSRLHILPFANLKDGSGSMLIEDDQFNVKNGRMLLQANFNDNRNRLYMLAGGGEHSFKHFDLDYALSLSSGLYTTSQDRSVEWTNDTADLTIANNGYEFPEYKFADMSYANAQNYGFARNVDRWQNADNSLHSGELNFVVPFSIYRFIDSRIKFGGRYENRTIDRGNSLNYYFNPAQSGPLLLSEHSYQTDWDMTGTSFGKGPELDQARWNPWFDSHKDAFSTRNDLSQEALLNTYTVEEKNLAAYLMGEFAVLGNTTVAGGVRIESTKGTYTGNLVERIDINTVNAKGDSTVASSSNDIIPSIFIRHHFNEKTMLNVSLVTGKKRPNYYELVPWQQIDPVSRKVSKGNPDLKPERVLKGQIEFSHIFDNLGFASVLFYFAEQTELVIVKSKTIWSPAKYAGWRSVSPVNSDIRQNFGAEATLNSPLSFLPDPFNDFSLYSNVRYLLSLVQVSEPVVRTVNLPGITPWELNLGLEYNNGKFSGFLQTHYSPPHLFSVNSSRLYKVYLDQYQRGELTLDFLCRYKIADRIQLFANFMNITNTPRNIFVSELATADDPLYNPDVELPKVHNHYLDNGYTIQVGTQFDF